MKITVILMIVACIHVSASGLAQKITLSEKKASLEKVFKKINAQSGYLFFYDLDLLKNAQPVDIHVKNADLDEVLSMCLKGQNLEYTITNKIIVIKSKEEAGAPVTVSAPVFADIRGSVRDETGKPLSGASIKLKGTDRGTTTDADGNFTIQVPSRGGTLIISYIGYQTLEVTASGIVNVQLRLSENTNDAAVVIGYGTQKKRDLTGSLSTVNAKDFEAAPVVRLDQALQGRSAGVQVTTASGSPGGDVRIRIRGANSLTGDNSPLYVVDGFVGADFTTLNTDDIANIQILKDASATAIYGSRGANGVVIVTTKTGTKGKMQVDVTSKYYSSRIIKRYPIMNAADFATNMNERYAALYPGTPPRFSDDQIAGFEKTGGTNWQDQIFRTAPGQEHQLTLSGGSDKTSFLVSANYLNQKGVIDNSDYTRYSFRSNLTSQLSKNLSLRVNFAGNRNENHNTGGTAARGGPLGQALAWAPTTPVYDSAGNYILHDPTSSIFQNPVALAYETDNRTYVTNMNLVSGLRYQFIPDLSLDVQFGINYSNVQGMGYSGPDLGTTNASRSSSENILWQNTDNLTYKHVFNKDHSLEVTGVFETQKFAATGFNVGVNDLTYPSQSYNNLALSSSSNVGSGYSEWALESLLGRINYAYKDKYLVSASVRRDGSSKFQTLNKWSTFPSAAVGWRVTEEPFMQNQNIFHNLKLRASWGLTGNQGINPYGTLSTYVTDAADAGSVFSAGPTSPLVSGVLLGNPGNPDLKWETTDQKNGGLDMEFLGGKLSASVDYFIKKTRNLLLSEPIPGYLGGNSILTNIGSMNNKGWEFSVNVNVVAQKDFSWTSSANVSLLRNKLVSLGEGKSSIEIDPFILKPGDPIGTFYGYKYLGTFKNNAKDMGDAGRYKAHPGDANYYNANGDSSIDTKDFVEIGNSLPRTSLGWNNTFNYKNFTLNIFFEGLLGFDKMNYSYAFGMLGGTDAREFLFSDIKNRYIDGKNETSNIPHFATPTDNYAGNSLIQSSRFVESAAFVRLKNLSAAYTLPRKMFKDVMSIKFFASVTNLITFTHYRGIDPEATSSAPEGNINGFEADTQQGIDQGAYPNSVMWTFGINVHF